MGRERLREMRSAGSDWLGQFLKLLWLSVIVSVEPCFSTNPIFSASFLTIASGNDIVGLVYESQNKDKKTVRFQLIKAGG